MKTYTFSEAQEIADKINSKLRAEYIGGEWYVAGSSDICGYYLEATVRGDWKHDHLYMEHVTRTTLSENKIDGDVFEFANEPSDEDWYVGYHRCVLGVPDGTHRMF